MKKWKEFLDTLNTPGGHVFILLFCSTGLLFAVWKGLPKADALLGEAFAVLLYAMRGEKTNSDLKGK
jgi:hypothetical protein